jgi:carboxypeptidase PM20D1
MKGIPMKLLLSILGLTLVLLLSVLFLRTMWFPAKSDQAPAAVNIPVDGEKVAQHLAQALSIRTVSHEDPGQFAENAFREFHAYLSESFPKVHTSLKKETVGNFGLLYVWQGSEERLQPILLMAHQDVVPVIPETESAWTHPPFAGEISEGYIWGRGSLDNKSNLVGILEAVEMLLQEGFQPRRTVYLAFGQDEEIGGAQGAAKIAQLLRSRKVRLEYVLDEGGVITEGIIPGVATPVALVGIAEKGYLTLELTVPGEGGHSSRPSSPTTIGALSKALVRLEENPFPADLTFTQRIFAKVGLKIPFQKRFILANLWLFGPWVEKMLSKSPEMNASIRTTIAPTMLSAGVKANVLPVKATAVVNFRVMPGETTSEVIARVQKIVDDPLVQIEARENRSEPSPVSDVRSESYEMLVRTIRQIASEKELLVSPFLVLGATDSRYYSDLSDNIYRCSLIKVGSEDIKRIHGTNERIAVENFAQQVQFYYQLLRNSQEL